jgi:hypothetical protein
LRRTAASTFQSLRRLPPNTKDDRKVAPLAAEVESRPVTLTISRICLSTARTVWQSGNSFELPLTTKYRSYQSVSVKFIILINSLVCHFNATLNGIKE